MVFTRRNTIRLRDFDYASANSYFVTICTQNRECLFGEIKNGEMVLNSFGEIVHEEWQRSAILRSEISIGPYVVMPNHFHGIVNFPVVGAHGVRPQIGTMDQQMDSESDDSNICNGSGACHAPLRKPRSLATFIAGFKSSATSKIRKINGLHDFIVWQRNYYEHIIRNENDYCRIAEYIFNNPAKWDDDQENPKFNLV